MLFFFFKTHKTFWALFTAKNNSSGIQLYRHIGKQLGIQALNENENVPKSKDVDLMNGGDYGCLEGVYIVLGYW